MATEIEPQHIEQQPEEAAEPTRGDRIKAAFTEQRGNAGARTRDWLAGGDLDEVDVIQMAAEKKQRKHDERVAQQERLVGELRGKLHTAKAQAEIEDNPRRRPEVASLGGRAAQAEARLEALRATPVLPPTAREIAAARTSKKAGRAAILAGGGLGGLSVLGTAIEQTATGQPMLLAVVTTAAGYGWYLISRPFVRGQAGEVPFGMTPASLPRLWSQKPRQVSDHSPIARIASARTE